MIHVALYTWGAWAVLPAFMAGIAFGRVWSRWIDALYFFVPGFMSAAIVITAIFEYRT